MVKYLLFTDIRPIPSASKRSFKLIPTVILERISFLREYGSFNREYDESACIWDLLHRLDELNDYIKCVDALHTCLAASDIHSAGFLGLKAYVEKIYADNGFAELKKDISEN